MSESDDSVGRSITTVETTIGTSVVETPKRIKNPVTGRTEDLTNLNEDGYCRKFLATLSASGGPNVVNLDSSPVACFEKDRWELHQQDGRWVLIKREPEDRFDELVLDDQHDVEGDADG